MVEIAASRSRWRAGLTFGASSFSAGVAFSVAADFSAALAGIEFLQNDCLAFSNERAAVRQPPVLRQSPVRVASASMDVTDSCLLLRVVVAYLLKKRREEIDGHGQEGRRVVLAGNFPHRLKEPQLQS